MSADRESARWLVIRRIERPMELMFKTTPGLPKTT
jgi:hypothetical protein